jgi:uncharacterized delta-60 repeat protein
MNERFLRFCARFCLTVLGAAVASCGGAAVSDELAGQKTADASSDGDAADASSDGDATTSNGGHFEGGDVSEDRSDVSFDGAVESDGGGATGWGQDAMSDEVALEEAAVMQQEASAADGRTDPSGILDTTFAGVGYVVDRAARVEAGSPVNSLALGIATDSKGRIIVGGRINDASYSEVAVWRITDPGTFDSSFGTEGAWWATSVYDGGVEGAMGAGVVVDEQDRPVIAGRVGLDGAPELMTIWRLGTSGALDPSFQGTGSVSAPSGPGSNGEFAHAVARDSAGNIIVAGASYIDSDQTMQNMVVWRYTSDGNADGSFANPLGRVVAPIQDAIAIAIDHAGAMIVAGTAYDAESSPQAAIVRYTQTGSLDTTFHGVGQAAFSGIAGNPHGPADHDYATGVAIDRDGGVVFVGLSDDSHGQDRGFVGRLTADGVRDTSFGESGFVVLDAPPGIGSWSYARAVALDSKGRIVVAGTVRDETSQTTSVAVWRLGRNGVLDASFGAAGLFAMTGTAGLNPFQAGDTAQCVAVDGYDRPILAGTSAGVGASYMTVWRLTP